MKKTRAGPKPKAGKPTFHQVPRADTAAKNAKPREKDGLVVVAAPPPIQQLAMVLQGGVVAAKMGREGKAVRVKAQGAAPKRGPATDRRAEDASR